MSFVISKAKAAGTETENADGSLTRFGMEILHRYAVRWIDHAERDLILERAHPELASAFYDIRADSAWAREQYIPFDDIEPVLTIPLGSR